MLRLEFGIFELYYILKIITEVSDRKQDFGTKNFINETINITRSWVMEFNKCFCFWDKKNKTVWSENEIDGTENYFFLGQKMTWDKLSIFENKLTPV